MSSAGVVSRAADKLKRANPDVSPRTRIRRTPRLVGQDESHAEIRQRDNLPEPAHVKSGKQRQMVPLAITRQPHGAPQHVRREMHVSIGKEQPLAGSPLGSQHQRMRFAEPSRRKLAHFNHLQPRIRFRKLPQNRARSILRTVIHSNHFIARIVLREQRRQRRRKLFRLVARRKNHGNRRSLGVRYGQGIAEPRHTSHTKSGARRLHNPSRSDRAK